MNQKLSEIIYQHRTELGFGVKRYAKAVGVAKGVIEKLENGEVRNPRIETMQKLSQFIGCRPDVLWAALRREQSM